MEVVAEAESREASVELPTVNQGKVVAQVLAFTLCVTFMLVTNQQSVLALAQAVLAEHLQILQRQAA